MSQPKPFSEMTEEERVEWAKNHTWQSRKKSTGASVSTSGKSVIKQKLKSNLKDKAVYADPEKRKKWWGDDYNARLRYLYQHNEEFRELKKYRVQLRRFKNKRGEYKAWTHKYYQEYRNKMHEHGIVFRLEGTQNFVKGFNDNDLEPYSPAKKALRKSLRNYNVIPAPKYKGHRWNEKTKKFDEHAQDFYLVTEIEAYLKVFVSYRDKFNTITKDEQRLYLKKRFWETMLKAREEFDRE